MYLIHATRADRLASIIDIGIHPKSHEAVEKDPWHGSVSDDELVYCLYLPRIWFRSIWNAYHFVIKQKFVRDNSIHFQDLNSGNDFFPGYDVFLQQMGIPRKKVTKTFYGEAGSTIASDIPIPPSALECLISDKQWIEQASDIIIEDVLPKIPVYVVDERNQVREFTGV